MGQYQIFKTKSFGLGYVRLDWELVGHAGPGHNENIYYVQNYFFRGGGWREGLLKLSF